MVVQMDGMQVECLDMMLDIPQAVAMAAEQEYYSVEMTVGMWVAQKVVQQAVMMVEMMVSHWEYSMAESWDRIVVEDQELMQVVEMVDFIQRHFIS